MMNIKLNPASVSDQRFPCSVERPDSRCTAKAQFRITPTCSCDEQAWPTIQTCAGHLARVVRIASARCTGHAGGSVVRVRQIGTP